MANLALDEGDDAAARALEEESLAIRRELGDRSGVASTLTNLGNIACRQGDFTSARVLLDESVAILRKLDDRSGLARCLLGLGDVAHGQGDYPAARSLRLKGLAILWEVGEQGTAISYSLERLAAVDAALGNALRAARSWGAAERLREEIGSPLPPNERTQYDRRVAAARAALQEDTAFGRAWQEGGALTLKQAIDLALEKETGRG